MIVAGVMILVAIITVIARKLGSPHHGRVEVAGLDLPSGIVLFTSTECSNCKEALARAKETGAPLREITYEIEAARFESAGISGVPLTLVIDGEGSVIEQIAGVPGRRRLRRALDRAGV